MSRGKRGPTRTVFSIDNLVRMGVPKSMLTLWLKDYDIESDEPDNTLRETRLFFQGYLGDIDETFDEGKGFYLNGPNGTGKTMLSAICLKEFHRYRYTVKRCMFAEFISEQTRTWGDVEAEAEFYAKIRNVDFLVLDEVGKEIESKIATPLLEDVIRYRYDKGWITSIVTNLTPKQLERRYGASVASIVKETMIPVHVYGADYRARMLE